MGQGPYGPGPIWARSRAHMGQGPYGPGPGPIWARAHMGSGPLGPGPFLVGRTPHQKTHPGKKESKMCFSVVFWKQKRCGTSVRSFSSNFRAEISATCQKTKVSVFEKKKLILSVIWSVICPRNLPRNLPSEFASKKWSRKCHPHPTSTCGGGQDDVSSQVNSLKLKSATLMGKRHPKRELRWYPPK